MNRTLLKATVVVTITSLLFILSTSLFLNMTETIPRGKQSQTIHSLSSRTATSPQQQHHWTLYNRDMLGRLNYDVWKQPVGYLVDDLRIKRDFPNRPELRQTIDKLSVTFNVRDKDSLTNKYGHKIYGYLLPSKSGMYRLRVVLSEVTAACSVELWLSSNYSPLSARLVVSAEIPIQDKRHKKVGKVFHIKLQNTVNTSKETYLYRDNAYYFEFLEKAFDGKCIASIEWKKTGQYEFKTIQPPNFVMAVQLNGSKYVDGWPVVEELKGDLPSNHLQSHSRVKYIGDTVYNISDIDVLESCEFKSKFTHHQKLRRQYEGIHKVEETMMFPTDPTVITWWRKQDRRKQFMTERRAQIILEMYETSFRKKGYRGNVKINKIEESENGKSGSRFLLELDIRMTNRSEILHASEYVYLANGANSLCHTSNFQWKKNVDVYLIVAVKNLGVWVQHLIHNMEHIYKVTGDKNFELVIVDYHSEDMNLEPLLKSSSLPRWKFISLEGNFSRSGGLQAGLDYVSDPDSIAMTIDMHLSIPPGFVEYIRRHVVQGKMGFAPMFIRLSAGHTEINIDGFWEVQTYGLVGMFKSDWTAIGGFDTDRYNTQWGGEDWDIVDKIVSHGIEVFRVRYPGLVHYFHTKTRLWNKAKIRH